MCLIHENRLILRHDAIIFSELLTNSYWYIEGKKIRTGITEVAAINAVIILLSRDILGCSRSNRTWTKDPHMHTCKQNSFNELPYLLLGRTCDGALSHRTF